MADIYRIRIDLHKLRANLSSGEGRELSEADVLELLEQAGFRRVGSGEWECEDVSLRWLNRSEITSCRELRS